MFLSSLKIVSVELFGKGKHQHRKLLKLYDSFSKSLYFMFLVAETDPGNRLSCLCLVHCAAFGHAVHPFVAKGQGFIHVFRFC